MSNLRRFRRKFISLCELKVVNMHFMDLLNGLVSTYVLSYVQLRTWEQKQLGFYSITSTLNENEMNARSHYLQ